MSQLFCCLVSSAISNNVNTSLQDHACTINVLFFFELSLIKIFLWLVVGVSLRQPYVTVSLLIDHLD
jgi:hypothetical protein